MLGFGMGLVFMPAMKLATLGVQRHDAGVASAMVSTSQQVGGAIGTSLLSTIANSATAGYAKAHASGVHTVSGAADLQSAAMVHGFSIAFAVAAGLLALAGLSAALLVNARPLGGHQHSSGDGDSAATEPVAPALAH